MTDRSPELAEVQQRLAEIQTRKRPGLRWNVSKHTAEMAIVVADSRRVACIRQRELWHGHR